MSAKTTKMKAETKSSAEATKSALSVKPSNGKKRLVVSFKNLPPEVLELVKEKYPKGYSDDVIKVDKGNGDFFYAITLDTDDTSYLIKVDVKVDTEIEEVERQLFGGSNDAEGDDVNDDFPETDGDFGEDASDDE